MVKEDYRIFVGGLSWDMTERQLERAFGRFGKVIESQMGLEKLLLSLIAESSGGSLLEYIRGLFQ